MKKLCVAISMIVSTAIPVLAGVYPPDYGNQTAYVYTNGPALLAIVNTTGLPKYVIGYRKSGFLNANPNRDAFGVNVDAWVRVECKPNFGSIFNAYLNKDYKIFQEMRFKEGFLSGPVLKDVVNGCAKIESIEMAFHANGRWDSNSGSNFYFDCNKEGMYFKSSGFSSEINPDTWDFIISKLRE